MALVLLPLDLPWYIRSAIGNFASARNVLLDDHSSLTPTPLHQFFSNTILFYHVECDNFLLRHSTSVATRLDGREERNERI